MYFSVFLQLPVSGMPTQSNSSPAAQSNGSRPMTRYQAKVEHARAEHERIQTIHKVCADGMLDAILYFVLTDLTIVR